MILSCQNITKSFDGKTILKQANFHIEDHEKAAIIGINGAGKTTLLNIIMGKLQPDEGVVSISKGKTIGYLEQNPILDSENTIFDELMSVKDLWASGCSPSCSRATMWRRDRSSRTAPPQPWESWDWARIR